VTVTVPEMTRFLLSLEQAVDLVFAALESARPGETWVPQSPSARVIDLARALVGNRPVEIREQGIRPGEKMPEVVVSEAECHHTYARGAHYAIAPMLPELRDPALAGARPLGREVSSASAVVPVEELVELLRRHQLLVEQVPAAAGELLR